MNTNKIVPAIIADMDFRHINNISEINDELYSDFVEWLKATTAVQLAAAKGNRNVIIDCVRHFLEFCKRIDLTAGEYTDFFCVDTPNIVEMGGLSGEEGDF